jgi:hypothetical protein
MTLDAATPRVGDVLTRHGLRALQGGQAGAPRSRRGNEPVRVVFVDGDAEPISDQMLLDRMRAVVKIALEQLLAGEIEPAPQQSKADVVLRILDAAGTVIDKSRDVAGLTAGQSSGGDDVGPVQRVVIIRKTVPVDRHEIAEFVD